VEGKKGAAMAGFWGRIKAEIVQEVPDEIAYCEFECHKEQCTGEECQACPMRLAWAARNHAAVRKAGAAASAGPLTWGREFKQSGSVACR